MARKRRTNGMPLTGDYLIVFSDGTRGTIRKFGRRSYASFPRTVKISPLPKKLPRRKSNPHNGYGSDTK
jgi:hypothetical protein